MCRAERPQCSPRAKKLMAHTSDMKQERWKVFVEAREMPPEAVTIADHLLHEQIMQRGSRKVLVSAILC